MKKITEIIFECESITPMFMYGADGKTPELRPASIKGVMRFWWRAIHGNLSLSELKKKESEIFGSTDKKSSFRIRIKHQTLKTENINPLPHKLRNGKPIFKMNSFQTNQTFKIIFTGNNLDLVENLFKLSTILGGFGQRSRRGFGSIKIVGDEVLTSSESIDKLIKQINSNFKYSSKINYPYIQIGKKYKDFQNLLDTIGRASHNNNCDELGYAKGKKRLASPIYVSILKFGDNDYRPIITTLKNTRLKNTQSTNDGKVSNFKKAIL